MSVTSSACRLPATSTSTSVQDKTINESSPKSTTSTVTAAKSTASTIAAAKSATSMVAAEISGGPTTYRRPFVSGLDETAQPDDGWPTQTKFMREYKRRSKFLYISHLPANLSPWQFQYLRETLVQFPLCNLQKDNGVTNTCHFRYAEGKLQTILVEYGDWREAKAALPLLQDFLPIVFEGVGVYNVAEATNKQQNELMRKWEKKIEDGDTATTEAAWRRWQAEEVQRMRDLAAQWALEDARWAAAV